MHKFATNNGVRIHYAALGPDEAPLIVMIHGFPDFWFTWRKQMEGLSPKYRIAAMDLRGYNRSDKPKGVDAYAMENLVGDVAAVIKTEGREKAIICGHDWGGAIAWTFAMTKPDLTEKLIILNLPHPKGLMRELANNAQQKKNAAYARNFQQKDAYKALTAEGLAGWVKDAEARKHYVEAFRRSSFEAMLNYYKKNYPRPPYEDSGDQGVAAAASGKVKCPVLMIHGLKDPYLLAAGLNGTWDWLERDLTLVTIPGASHFVQQDAPDLVTRSIRMWLGR